MGQGQFLVRNRHSNRWYGRVIIPQALRPLFNQRRELRISLDTADRRQAKRRSLNFWLQCQEGFERLHAHGHREEPFEKTTDFTEWLSQGLIEKERYRPVSRNKLDKMLKGGETDPKQIHLEDAIGGSHTIDLGDPDKEAELALKIQEQTAALLEKYQDNPEMLDRLFKAAPRQSSVPAATAPDQPETVAAFDEAIDLYIQKLSTRGRKGKRLAVRTLLTYKDKLTFWQEYFGQKHVHTLTLKELNHIQNWIPALPANIRKKQLSVEQAVTMAVKNSGRYPPISAKTRAEYVGQLKGLLEYCYASGFTKTNLSLHVELPNTKQGQTIQRLPFTTEDLQKIFPGKAYGVDFGTHKTGLPEEVKFWFPLLAAFTGARLEELGQLQTRDIHTDPATGIAYMMIDDKGTASDGVQKRTKNMNSVRPIPIHSTLIHMGFLDYVKRRQQDKSDRSLFKLTRDKQGRLARGVSNWFSRMDRRTDGTIIKGYIERRGVESEGITPSGERWTKSFHSFRHTVIDNLRGKQLASGEFIREQDIALVVGHERKKVETANYGIDRNQLELRKAIIETITYDGVSFGDIKKET